MAELTLKRGKETLTVAEPTFGGITALERLGWKVESGRKPARPKPRAAKAAGAFDEAAARAEIEAGLREDLEAKVRAELEEAAKAEAEKDAADKAKAADSAKK